MYTVLIIFMFVNHQIWRAFLFLSAETWKLRKQNAVCHVRCMKSRDYSLFCWENSRDLPLSYSYVGFLHYLTLPFLFITFLFFITYFLAFFFLCPSYSLLYFSSFQKNCIFYLFCFLLSNRSFLFKILLFRPFQSVWKHNHLGIKKIKPSYTIRLIILDISFYLLLQPTCFSVSFVSNNFFHLNAIFLSYQEGKLK